MAHLRSTSRNTVLKYCNNCVSLVLHYSRARLATQVELSYRQYSVAISNVYYSQSDFEIVFYSPCNITDVVYRGWAGERGWGGWWGWVCKPEVGSPCHQGTYNGAVPSVGDRYVHNPQDGSRWTLSAVSHHTNS